MQKYIQKVIHSIPIEITRDKIRDALRLGLQSSIAAAVTFLIMRSLEIPETFLAIISTIYIMERSIGTTLTQAQEQVTATIVGILIGVIFVTLIPYGYGTIISLLVTMFIMNAITAFKPNWKYGAVAAVAISLGAESQVLEISLERLIAIAVGVGVGLIVAVVVWPETSTQRALKHIRSALNSTRDLFKITFHNTRLEEKEDLESLDTNFNSKLGNAKNAVYNMHGGNKQKYQKIIAGIEKLYNSILIIRRVSNNSSTSLLDYGKEFQENCDKLSEKTCEIITRIINKEMIEDQTLESYQKLIHKIKNCILEGSEREENDIFRHAFVFGIQETQESLRVLEEIMEVKKIPKDS